MAAPGFRGFSEGQPSHRPRCLSFAKDRLYLRCPEGKTILQYSGFVFVKMDLIGIDKTNFMTRQGLFQFTAMVLVLSGLN